MDIIQKRSYVLTAKRIVAATSNNDCRTDRQVTHRVTESGARRFSCCLQGYELTLDNFAIDCDRFEEFELVRQLSITLLATEVVNPILDCVTLKVD